MSGVSRYHPLLVTLHWLLAVLLVAALALGALALVEIPNSDPMKLEALRSHMAGGGLILVLMLVRLLVRARSAHPAPATAGHPLLDRLAWASHRLFYAVVLALPASGLAMALQMNVPAVVFAHDGSLPPDFWIFPVRWVHYAIARLLMGLIVLHVAGALYHAVVLRDGLLRRMAFGRRVIRAAAPANHGSLAKVRP